jgi:hypothetical protein
MQAIWMVMMSFVLALSGVLGLALVTHVTSRTRRPVRQRASMNSTGPSATPATFPPRSATVPLGSSRATGQGSGEGQR